MHTKHFAFVILSIIFITALIVALGITTMVNAVYATTKINYVDYLLSPAPAYGAAVYANSEFFAELRAFESERSKNNFAGTFRGRYFSETAGLRTVVGQPTDAPHTLYLYGSSVIYNSEVPDAYTLPSQVQASLGANYRVVGLSENGENIARFWQLLQDRKLKQGDVVIYYGGVMDAAYDGTAEARIQKTRRYVKLAKEFCRETGTMFYFVLEPTIWSAPLAQDELSLGPMLTYGQARTDEIVSVYRGYETLADLDLYHSLDETRRSQLVYFDSHHVNDQANIILGRLIANAIAPTF